MAEARRRILRRATLAALLAAAPTLAQGRPDERPIGVATREADGTLVLTLRAEGPKGLIGDAQFRYAPADEDYAMVARHVGPIPVGGSVPVRPFGEQ